MSALLQPQREHQPLLRAFCGLSCEDYSVNRAQAAVTVTMQAEIKGTTSPKPASWPNPGSSVTACQGQRSHPSADLPAFAVSDKESAHESCLCGDSKAQIKKHQELLSLVLAGRSTAAH